MKEAKEVNILSIIINPLIVRGQNHKRDVDSIVIDHRNCTQLSVYSIPIKMKELPVILLLIFAFVNQGFCRTSLNGDWQVTVENVGKKFIGTVPGGIYTDLQKAKLIPDTLKKFNDVQNRWIGNRTITYTKVFEVSEKEFGAPTVRLIFEGLDTFATIYFNNHEIAKTSNMFLQHTFDVKNHLKIGRNNVTVIFASALKVAQDLYNKQAANYVVPPICPPKNYNGECHVNHIRKMQASFSWDWGPATPSAGIWKDVWLHPIYEPEIIDTSVEVVDQGKIWKLIATSRFAVGLKNQSQPIFGVHRIKLDISETLSFERVIKLDTNETYFTDSIMLRVPKDDVELWWPNGYGNQTLYSVIIELEVQKEPLIKTQISKKIGFRTVELVQDRRPKKGRRFFFRINNIPIFAKGSNWIPASIFPELSSDKDVVRNLLESAKIANMNMLRIWGGGLYESEYFYDLADEYGIMIWQDFLFACAMYPTNQEFLDSVKEEIVYNVNRLKHRPSIVIWAGSNENEAAIYGNWYGTGNASIYKEDYLKLYVDVVKKEVQALDHTRPFVVSSPSDGLFTDQNGFIGPDPYSNFYGDVHYYNYLENGWNINQYPIPRFASEYGFQSIPCIETLKSATDEIEDLKLGSDFLKHRQHLPAGWSIIDQLIRKNFVVPQSNDSHRDFADYVYLSQIDQAVSVKIQTESYRQLRSSENEIGEGFTMGAMYWQLNDVWQAPTWSSIDFKGRWKMLHYYALDFFAPIIISPRVSNAEELEIYVVSDKLISIEECLLKIRIYKWNSTERIFAWGYTNLTINPNSADVIDTLWMTKFLERPGCGFHTANPNCFIELILLDKNRQLIAPINYVFPAPMKDVNLPKTVIKVRVNPNPIPGKFWNYLDYNIEVNATNIALFVWLETPNIQGRFSENGFHVIGKKIIIFHAREAITAEQLLKDLKIRTLSDLYDSER